MEGNGKKSNRKKGTLRINFIIMSVVPVLFLGLVIAVFNVQRFSMSMYTEVETELENTSYMVANTYDRFYPGDYSVVASDTLEALKKGDAYLEPTIDFLESIYEDTDSEITFFYGDIRYVTTLEDSEGKTMTGTKANPVIKKDVIDGDKAHFYKNVDVNGRLMSAYYLPLHNSDGSTVGMLAILRDAKKVNNLVYRSVIPTVVISLIVMVVVAVLTYMYSNHFVVKLEKIKEFLLSVESGDLRSYMDETIVARDDELGKMSRAAVSMQRSLKELVERDALTTLYNRRYANQKLRDIWELSDMNGTNFAISIGDIDYFKSVNDTYGHEAGDEVLIAVSKVLRNYMIGKGFVARWGGEEFLLLFRNMDGGQAKVALNDLLDKVHEIAINYDNKVIKVNMSFGVVGYEYDKNMKGESGRDGDEAISKEIERTLRRADERLYYAKMHGRNRVVGEKDM